MMVNATSSAGSPKPANTTGMIARTIALLDVAIIASEMIRVIPLATSKPVIGTMEIETVYLEENAMLKTS